MAPVQTVTEMASLERAPQDVGEVDVADDPLTIALEEAFADQVEFEIRDEDAENIRSIQDILKFLADQGIS